LPGPCKPVRKYLPRRRPVRHAERPHQGFPGYGTSVDATVKRLLGLFGRSAVVVDNMPSTLSAHLPLSPAGLDPPAPSTSPTLNQKEQSRRIMLVSRCEPRAVGCDWRVVPRCRAHRERAGKLPRRRRRVGRLVLHPGDDQLDLFDAGALRVDVVGDDAAAAHDHDAVDDLEDVMDVVGDEDTGMP
jgi:hypothetical protein